MRAGPTKGRHRRRIEHRSERWLRAGAAAAGLGAALAIGQGVAHAQTGDPDSGAKTDTASNAQSANNAPTAVVAKPSTAPDKTTATTTPTDTDTKNHDAADAGTGRAEPPVAPTGTIAEATAPTSAPVRTKREKLAEADPPEAAEITSAPITTAAPTARTASAPTDSTVSARPTAALTDGVITGDVGGTDSAARPLTYTEIKKPDKGGYTLLDTTSGKFTYVPDSELLASKGTERFTVLASETTDLDKTLQDLPLIGGLATQVLLALHQDPLLSKVLAPLIGASAVVPVDIDLGAVVPNGAPVARRMTVTSGDGTKIAAYFFPASGLQAGQTAPTILNGPGLGSPGDRDPNSPWGTDPWNIFTGNAPLRHDGYNVITWDPRGEYDSTGVLHLDSADFEGHDVSAIIDSVARLPEAQLDHVGDPRLGMIGGSYGGGIQLVTAATDHRIDAIVPAITWNSLTTSLYENSTFKTAWSTLLLLKEAEIGADVLPDLYTGLLNGALTGSLTQSEVDLLNARNPQLDTVTTPTLLLQAAGDSLFGLSEAQSTAETLAAENVPVKMVWFCGGHGVCTNPGDAGAALVQADTLEWLDRYVKGLTTVSTGPAFEWIDQNGQSFSSALLPSDPAFQGNPIVASSTGGFLPIVPFIGGSGPQPLDVFPYSLTEASKAQLAVNLVVAATSTPNQIVGAPQLTFTYSGVGTAMSVFAQIVDNTTGLVLSDTVTPIPVVLDGATRSTSVPLAAIAYTMAAGDSLTVQLVGSATDYANLGIGAVTVSDMSVSLPTVAAPRSL